MISEDYEIIDDRAFARYSDGLIYIGDFDYLEDVKKYCSDKDILVLDRRNGEDPDMIIYNSYKILDKNKQLEILNALCSYEQLYPSSWNRTINTMQREWNAHNILYYMNYERYRTTDVDLDNADEETYKIKKKIFN